jgi:PAS domain S-box-containing protein
MRTLKAWAAWFTPGWVRVATLAAVAGLAWVDYYSPPQVSFTLSYLLAGMAAAWGAGWRWGVLVTVLAVTCRGLEEYWAHSTLLWIVTLNWGMRLGASLIVVVVAARVVRLTRGLEQAVAERTARLSAEVEEHRQTKVELQASRDRFRDVVEHISEVFWVTDGDTPKLSYLSPAYETVWGRSCQSALDEPRNWLASVHPEDRSRVLAQLPLQAEGRYAETYRLVRPDGAVRWIRDRAFPIRDAAGQVQRIVGLAADVTDLVQAQRQVSEQAARLRTVVEGAPIILFALDAAGRSVFETGRGPLHEGWSRGGNLGLTPEEAFPHAPRFAAAARQALAGEVVDEVVTVSGLAFHCRYQPQFDRAGKVTGVIGVATDVTERERARKCLRAQCAATQALTDAHTLETAGAVVLGIIGEHLDWDCAALWLQERDTALLACRAAWRRDEPALAEFERCLRGLGRDPGTGLPGRVAASGEAAWLTELTRENLPHRWTEARRAGLGSAVACPVRQAGKVIGVIECFSRALVPEDAGMLETLLNLGASLGHSVSRYEAEQRLEIQAQILASLTEGVALADTGGRIRLTNPAFHGLFGYGEGELTGLSSQSLLDLPAEAAAACLRDAADSALREGRWSGPLPLRHRQGRAFSGLVTLSPLQGEVPPLLVMAVLDITERARAEEALRASEERHRKLVRMLPDACLVFDLQGRVAAANPSAARLHGFASAEEMTGRGFAELVLPEQIPQARRRMAQAAVEEAMGPAEYTLLRADGGRFIAEITTSALRNAAGTIEAYLSLGRDITDRRRLERQLIEISDRAQAQFGQEIHDGFCQVLVGAAFDANALRRRLAAVAPAELADVERLCRLLDDAITEARRLAQGLFPVVLDREGLRIALAQMTETASGTANARVRLVESGGRVTVSDPSLAIHLFRIAQEALNNALRHSGARRIEVRLTQARDLLSVSVCDDGCGLAPDARAGTGMGLHIMAYRARALGGTLEVRARATGGTEIRCRVRRPAEG